jgi:small subunit ribosomal protein S11
MAEGKKTGSKKKKVKKVPYAIAYIKSTFNNTIVTFTDLEGNVLYWSSGGKIGYKGTKKGTPYSAQKAALEAAQKVKEIYGVEKCAVFIKGPGPGRETAIRAIQNAGIQIVLLRDVTPIPHNGCRAPGRRRV